MTHPALRPTVCRWENLPLPLKMWCPWDKPANHVFFRRRFETTAADTWRLSLAASGPTRIWVDDKVVELPEGFLPSWRSIAQVSFPLEAGQHEIKLESDAANNQQPFVLLCLDSTETEPVTRICSDPDWELSLESDGKWEPVWAFEGVWSEPWGMPCNAPMDFCRMNHGKQRVELETINRLVEIHQGLTTTGGFITLNEQGGITACPVKPFPAAPPSIPFQRSLPMWHLEREAHSRLTNNWLDLFEQRAPHVVLDAGRETFARVALRLVSGGPAILAITTGESIPELHRYDRRVSDVFQLADGETFTTTPVGFRYIKVVVLSGADTVVTAPIEVQHVLHDEESTGEFVCSDAAINEIWDLSVRTVHLCMQNEIWDGVKRDQLPWMGDLYTEVLACFHLFENADLARHSIRVLSEIGPAPARPLAEQQIPGLASIWKSPGGDINGIASYTMWWVVGLADYVMYTGDRSLVTDIEPEFVATLEHIAHWCNERGCVVIPLGRDYVDWAPVPPEERQVFCHLLAYQTLCLGLDLLAESSADLSAIRQTTDRMRDYARQTWCHDGVWKLGDSHHVQAMAIRSGLLDQSEAKQHFERSLAAAPHMTMTYWHRYADLDAAERVGEIQWGLDYLRKHWGQALQIGMTALWESFDASWMCEDPHAVSMIDNGYAGYGGYRTSLCHGWSAGPVPWLHRAVLGITPLAPGFERVEFAPELGDLEFAEGSIPTPKGCITVKLERQKDTTQCAEISVPTGVELVVRDGFKNNWQIVVKN